MRTRYNQISIWWNISSTQGHMYTSTKLQKKVQKYKIWEPDLTTYQDDEKCRNITQVHKYTCTKAHKK